MAVLFVVVAACDGSGAVTTQGQGDSSSPSVSESSSTTTTSTVVSGLRSEFVAWVAPVDGDEARLGWEAVGLPAVRRNLAAVADCWESAGFGTFADQVRSYDPGTGATSGRLLPDMATYRETGFVPRNLSLIPGVLAGDSAEHVASYIERSPEFGFRPEDVAAIQAVAKKCSEENEPPTFLIGPAGGGYGTQWLVTLDEIDQEPDIAGLIEDTVMPCLVDVGPEFANAEDIDGWLAAETGAQMSLDFDENSTRDDLEAALVEWGQGFAECMEPLVEARRQPRLEARSAFVDDQFTGLLQLQSDVDDFLAGS
ncbi:MAG: hypothetical protein WB245_08350 [Acidimicrobiia bacterium]